MANHNAVITRIKREYSGRAETGTDADVIADFLPEVANRQLDDDPADEWYETKNGPYELAENQFRGTVEGQGQAGGESLAGPEAEPRDARQEQGSDAVRPQDAGPAGEARDGAEGVAPALGRGEATDPAIAEHQKQEALWVAVWVQLPYCEVKTMAALIRGQNNSDYHYTISERQFDPARSETDGAQSVPAMEGSGSGLNLFLLDHNVNDVAGRHNIDTAALQAQPEEAAIARKVALKMVDSLGGTTGDFGINGQRMIRIATRTYEKIDALCDVGLINTGDLAERAPPSLNFCNAAGA